MTLGSAALFFWSRENISFHRLSMLASLPSPSAHADLAVPGFNSASASPSCQSVFPDQLQQQVTCAATLKSRLATQFSHILHAHGLHNRCPDLVTDSADMLMQWLSHREAANFCFAMYSMVTEYLSASTGGGLTGRKSVMARATTTSVASGTFSNNTQGEDRSFEVDDNNAPTPPMTILQTQQLVKKVDEEATRLSTGTR